jgi:hypothetical protein
MAMAIQLFLLRLALVTLVKVVMPVLDLPLLCQLPRQQQSVLSYDEPGYGLPESQAFAVVCHAWPSILEKLSSLQIAPLPPCYNAASTMNATRRAELAG